MNEKLPVWIDCDPGVDDAMALLLASRLEEVELVGVSTVNGNVPLAVDTNNALRLRELFGFSCPIYAGADRPLLRPVEEGDSFHGPDGLGGAVLPDAKGEIDPLPAWDALYAAARRYEGRLTLISIGPMTNLAIAFGKYAALPSLLRRTLIMGGSATRGNCTPCAEFNVWADPEAAQAVLRAPGKKVLFPLEVTEEAYLTGEEICAFGERTPVARFFREATRDLLRKNIEEGNQGWCIHDACPVLYCAHPELFSGREAGVYVETRSELTRGKTVTDLFSDKQFPEKNCLVVLQINRKEFVKQIHSAVQ